jgi:hypothetical protein
LKGARYVIELHKMMASNGAFSTMYLGIAKRDSEHDKEVVVKQLKDDAYIQKYNEREIKALANLTGLYLN